jgi:hypothetical protein
MWAAALTMCWPICAPLIERAEQETVYLDTVVDCRMDNKNSF